MDIKHFFATVNLQQVLNHSPLVDVKPFSVSKNANRSVRAVSLVKKTQLHFYSVKFPLPFPETPHRFQCIRDIKLISSKLYKKSEIIG